MKRNFRLLPLFAAAVLLISAALFGACKNPEQEPQDFEGETFVQELDYSESTEKIDNPDQGFYRPVYVKLTADGATYNQNIVTASTQLYHLRIDISAFSARAGGSDTPLTDAALEGVDGLLALLRSRDKNAVVRFAYDPGFGGKANTEPDMELLLAHAKQFCTLLNKYPAVITALEAGMIGPWGEMHTSTIATLENESALIGIILENTERIPVLVRTPAMIYNYLGISASEAADYEIPSGIRLGIYNDGYLGSSTDLGTYTDRERDVAFVARLNERLPYGGEVVTPDSELHDIETCLPEMYQIHLSYLNVEWNNLVIDKWKSSTVTADCARADSLYFGESAFTYIQNRMGYRFVLKRSAFTVSQQYDKIKIDLNIENAGFGNLTKEKTAQVLFIDEYGEIALSEDIGSYNGDAVLSTTFALSLASGTYSVFLRLCGDVLGYVPLYCVAFANPETYNDVLQANYIGMIDIP